jgi:hypothetical protein
MVFSKFFDGVQKKDAPGQGDKSQEESKSPRNHSHSSATRGEESKKVPNANKRKHREDEQKPKSAFKHANGQPSSVEVSKKSRPAKMRRGPPSQEALQLSARLMEFSQQKQLKEALEVYWDEANNAIRDEHHACIMVNCCSRCGDIEVRFFQRQKFQGLIPRRLTHLLSAGRRENH